MAEPAMVSDSATPQEPLKPKKKLQTEKVSMNLTARDMDNVNYLVERLQSRQQVIAVSRSMEIARSLLEMVDQGGTLMVRDKDGNLSDLQILF